MKEKNRLDEELFRTINQNRQERLGIAGVNINEIKEQRRVIDERMNGIAEKYRELFHSTGTQIAKKHQELLLTQTKSMKNFLKDVNFDSFKLCRFYRRDYEAEQCLEDIEELFPSSDANKANVSAQCEQINSSIFPYLQTYIGRPYLELHANNEEVFGKVKCKLYFKHSVNRSAYYDILAKVQANGYYVFWPEGCSTCTTQADPTEAHLSITIRLQVYQMTLPVFNTPKELEIVNITSRTPPKSIDIDTEIGGYGYLEEAYGDATVIVEFEIDARIDGCGAIWVDLQTSRSFPSGFYFYVPYTYVCVSPWQIYELDPSYLLERRAQDYQRAHLP